MKVLLVNPEIRLDANPYHFPFWAGILASIVEKKGGHVAILDLNAIRMNHGGMYVPNKIIESEISSEKWDIIGIGGLTTTYNFTTQEKFAAVDSINRNRIRKNQEDMLKMLRYTEEQIARTKRDITKYFKS